ncbi:MAG: IS30 family transposase [Burkholderiales bacterium]|nr:IS30 family transposase [Burkholderiales bacterium]
MTQSVSHETIYQAVYLVPRGELRTELIAQLRRSHAKRMPRARGTNRKGGNIVNLVLLIERPAEADSGWYPATGRATSSRARATPAPSAQPWSVTAASCCFTEMNGCTAQHALEGFSRRFKTVIPEMRQSFTYDRGCEMARHQELTEATDMPVYFCEPYSPWQRGSNENMNGLVRQFLPRALICPPSPRRSLPTSKRPCSMTGLARSSTSERLARSIPKIVQAKLAERQAVTAKTVALQT